VVHGGSGSTLGALAAGVPLVVIPLFADQPYNARRVAEVRAGVAVTPNPADIPGTIAALRAAVEDVLEDGSYRDRAEALAAELRAEPPVDAAVPLLQRLGRR
jgi:UDP:flavonoid glycosyltransferase YjiC (YdhE family)